MAVSHIAIVSIVRIRKTTGNTVELTPEELTTDRAPQFRIIGSQVVHVPLLYRGSLL